MLDQMLGEVIVQTNHQLCHDNALKRSAHSDALTLQEYYKN